MLEYSMLYQTVIYCAIRYCAICTPYYTTRPRRRPLPRAQRSCRSPDQDVACKGFFFFDPEGLFQQEFRQFLLRRWTGNPPETLSGLTSMLHVRVLPSFQAPTFQRIATRQ